MNQLSDWADLEDQENLCTVAALLATPGERWGVYNTPSTPQELHKALRDCEARSFLKLPQSPLEILKLYDAPVGTIKHHRKEDLVERVRSGQLDPKTEVHLRCLYGNLFLFLLDTDLQSDHFATPETFVVVNNTSKKLWSAHIGPYPQPNAVYLQLRFDLKTSTLEKTLQSPHLRAYCTVQEENLYNHDLPQ